jgi:biotin carboxylase
MGHRVAHLVFVDTSSVGLKAFATARNLGHELTLIIPDDVSFIKMMGIDQSKINQYVENKSIFRFSQNLDNCRDFIKKIDMVQKIDAVLTTSEVAVMPTAAMAKAIGARYDSPEALEATVFKSKMREILLTNGLPSTAYGVATDLQSSLKTMENMTYPVVIKPVRGVAKESSAILKEQADLYHFFADESSSRTISEGMQHFLSKSYIIESYINGGLYSAEVIAVNGQVHLLCSSRRERATHNQLIEVAAAMPAGLSEEQEGKVTAYLQRVFHVLGLTIGIYHIEFIMQNETPVLVEINPRMMGGTAPLLYEKMTGTNPYELLIQLHLGTINHFKPPKITGAGVIIAVGARDGGTLADDAETASAHVLMDFPVLERFLKIKNGLKIPKFQGNLSNLGSIVLYTESWSQALEQSHALLLRLETALNIPLAKIEFNTLGL